MYFDKNQMTLIPVKLIHVTDDILKLSEQMIVAFQGYMYITIFYLLFLLLLFQVSVLIQNLKSCNFIMEPFSC